MADIKTTPNKLSVAAFLRAISDPGKRSDAKALAKLLARVSGERPTMWGPAIVGFGSYHYRYESGREGDMPRIGFSPRSAALTLYMMTEFSGAKPLMATLGKYSMGKSCMYIKRLADVDETVLETLASESLKAMRKKYPL